MMLQRLWGDEPKPRSGDSIMDTKMQHDLYLKLKDKFEPSRDTTRPKTKEEMEREMYYKL